MIQLFKHQYFKYLLLMLLSLKVSYVVIEHFTVIDDIEICYEIDIEDTENDDTKELGELEIIKQEHPLSVFFRLGTSKTVFSHIMTTYNMQFLEYTTQPPELKV